MFICCSPFHLKRISYVRRDRTVPPRPASEAESQRCCSATTCPQTRAIDHLPHRLSHGRVPHAHLGGCDEAHKGGPNHIRPEAPHRSGPAQRQGRPESRRRHLRVHRSGPQELALPSIHPGVARPRLFFNEPEFERCRSMSL